MRLPWTSRLCSTDELRAGAASRSRASSVSLIILKPNEMKEMAAKAITPPPPLRSTRGVQVVDRHRLNMTQAEFALSSGFVIGTMRNWGTGTSVSRRLR
jgi:hypothetical protein